MFVLLVVVGAVNGVRQMDQCPVVGAEGEADMTVENCEWRDKKAETDRPVEFKGKSLVVMGCSFIGCGFLGAYGGCILARAFTGDVQIVGGCRFESCMGDYGTIFAENTVEKRLVVDACEFKGCTHKSGGCICAEASNPSDLAEGSSRQRLWVVLVGVMAHDCQVSRASGAYVSSKQPRLLIERCEFAYVSGSGGKLEYMLWIFPEVSGVKCDLILQEFVLTTPTSWPSGTVIYISGELDVALTMGGRVEFQADNPPAAPIRLINLDTVTLKMFTIECNASQIGDIALVDGRTVSRLDVFFVSV
jgi:hypothetical protein